MEKKENNNQKKKDSSDLGKQIEDLVQNAIDTLNFDELSKSVGNTVKQWNEELNQSFQQTFHDTKHDLGSALQGAKKELVNAFEGAKRDVERSVQQEKQKQAFLKKKKKREIPYKKNDKEMRIFDEAWIVPIRKRSPLKVKAMLYTILSSLCVMGFGITALVFGIMWLLTGMFFHAFLGFFIPTICSLLFLQTGVELLKKNQRMMRYMELLKVKGYVEIKELEQYVGIKKKKVLREVKELLSTGALPEGHLDKKETCLIGTDEIYHQYKEMEEMRMYQQKKEEEKKKQMDEMSEEMKYLFQEIEEGKQLILEIRQVNRELLEPVISEKLMRLENISEKIFLHVEQNPSKIEEIRRLKNYYLPTILKLIRTYQKVGQSELAGHNMKKIQTEIEETLDTMNEALETMYDQLYSTEAMDVSADISVLKTILAREGLVKDGLGRAKEEKDNE